MLTSCERRACVDPRQVNGPTLTLTLTLAQVSLHFVELWDATTAARTLRSTPLPTMKRTWLAGSPIIRDAILGEPSHAEVLVTQTRPGLLWADEYGLRGTRALFLSMLMLFLACALAAFIRLFWERAKDLVERTSVFAGTPQVYDVLCIYRERTTRYVLYACGASCLVTAIALVSTWRVQMAPIIDGHPFTPELSAPPPTPPPIAGLNPLNGSFALRELARATNALCLEGSRGVLCADCEPYWYPTSEGICKRCVSTSFKLHPALVVVIIIFALGSVYAWVRRKRLMGAVANGTKWAAERWGVRIKQVLNWGTFKVVWASYQIMGSVSGQLNVRFPPPYPQLERFVSSLTELNLATLVPVECWGANGYRYDYLVQLHVAVWSPILLCAGVGVLSFLGRRWGVTRRGGFGFAVILISTLLPTAALKLFQYQACTRLADGSWWLTADLSLECPWHAGMPTTAAR